MTLLEISVRAVCREIGVDPDDWHAFAGLGNVALDAFIEALPKELAEAIRLIMQS